jgi:hypothetical protein
MNKMNSGLTEEAGGWRGLIAAFILLSFIALAGLLALSGHSQHLFLAVAYLLVAAFVFARVIPGNSEIQHDIDSDVDLRLENSEEDEVGRDCCTRHAFDHKEMAR